MSGSLNSKRAIEWSKNELENLGLDKVYLQPVMVPKWIRGTFEYANIETSPGNTINVPVCALGGSISTPLGGLRANVVEVKTFDELSEKKKNIEAPIILLTAKGEASERIEGLEVGADDYIVKPFAPKELDARIHSALRKTHIQLANSPFKYPNVNQFGPLSLNMNKKQVLKNGIKVNMTTIEFSLLELLVSRSGEPFSRGEILKEVWGYTPERHVDTRVVDVHISRLRSKLEADPANPELILTARGTGYLFQRIVDISPFDGK